MHFAHGLGGDFITANSYMSQADYDKIPSHRMTSIGRRVNLRNFLDFRSVMDVDSDFSNVNTGARINELPQVNDTTQADITYYLNRAYILYINTEGQLEMVANRDDFTPQTPKMPNGALPLFNIYLNGNTLHDSDTRIEKIDHRRYTMKDIAKLEERIDNIEEVAALNLLEMDTKNFKVLDSAGLDRTKSGFFVDNFSTQQFSQLNDLDYRASIDPQFNTLFPSFCEDNIRLIYDSAASTNVIRKGDNVYLKHNSIPYISQTKASKSILLNPFEAVIYQGDIELSPSSDEWKESVVRTKKILNGGTKLNTDQAYLWNNWQWNWGGTAVADLKVGSATNTQTDTTSTQIFSNTNKVVPEETL